VTLTVPFEKALGSLGTVRLQVVDCESGQPIAGARVALTDSQSGMQGQPVDGESKIELRYQRPGLLNVDIQGPRRAADEHRLREMGRLPRRCSNGYGLA
jgi:hypothetical protein